MIGKVFDRLTVLEMAPKGIGVKRKWLCLCSCGNKKIVTQSDLRTGNTKSCGCLRREGPHTTHGMKDTAVYRAWGGMKTRCTNPRGGHWDCYGGRGIEICERWLNSFENFYSDMGDKPFPEAQLDRIDNNKGYSPDNCRWVSSHENNRNKRTNVNVTHNGETMCLSDWADKLGLNVGTLKSRISKLGWDPLRALLTPTRTLQRVQHI